MGNLLKQLIAFAQRSIKEFQAHLTWRDGLIGLLAIAVWVNLGQFDDIDKRNKPRYRALYGQPTPDILEINKIRPHFRQQFGLSVALGKLFPGSLIIAPQCSSCCEREFRGKILSFGRSRAILLADYDPDGVLVDFNYSPWVVAQGPGGGRGAPFVIAAKAEAPETFLTIRRNGSTVLVETSLVSKDLISELLH